MEVEDAPNPKRQKRTASGSPSAVSEMDASDITKVDTLTPLQEAIRSKRRLYIKKLDYKATEAELEAFFTNAGFKVESVHKRMKQKKKKNCQKPTGDGFAVLTSALEAERAISTLNGKSIYDRALYLQLSTRAKPEPQVRNPEKKPKKAKARISSSEVEDGEIGEGDTSAGAGNISTREKRRRAKKEVAAFSDEAAHVFQRFKEVSRRVASRFALEQFVAQGRALLLTVKWPSKRQQTMHGKVQRQSLRSAFYSNLVGRQLDGMYAAHEPRDPNPDEPLRLLLVWWTPERAALAEKEIEKISFTEATHTFTIQVTKHPELVLGTLQHTRGNHGFKKNGEIIGWEGLSTLACKTWELAIPRDVLARIKKGQTSWESCLDQGGLDEMPSILEPAEVQPEAELRNKQPVEPKLAGAENARVFATQLLTTSFPQSAPPTVTAQSTTPHATVADDMDTDDDEPEYVPSPEPPVPAASELLRPHDSNVRSTLAQLTTEERWAQKRYYARVLDTDLARCQTCSVDGHMSETCPLRICEFCGVDDHFSSACHVVVKCTKCGQRGHYPSACSSRCAFCGEVGHYEDRCRRVYATFFRGDVQNLFQSIPSIIVFCYECGDEGHWGDDCRWRPPGKASSGIFSMREAGKYLTASRQNSVTKQHVRSRSPFRGRASENIGSYRDRTDGARGREDFQQQQLPIRSDRVLGQGARGRGRGRIARTDKNTRLNLGRYQPHR